MSSVVKICNSALVTLSANTINSLSEGSDEARACNVKWDIARRAALRLHPWNFAIKRSQLARTDTTPAFRYKYQYTIPSNCLRVLKVNLNGDYKLEGRNIITDSETCYIKYVYDNEDISEWDVLFVDLMASKMAVELAYTIPHKSTMLDRMFELYKMKLNEAQYVDSSEDVEDPLGQFDYDYYGVRF